jgi:hypothetical protein
MFHELAAIGSLRTSCRARCAARSLQGGTECHCATRHKRPQGSVHSSFTMAGLTGTRRTRTTRSLSAAHPARRPKFPLGGGQGSTSRSLQVGDLGCLSREHLALAHISDACHSERHLVALNGAIMTLRATPEGANVRCAVQDRHCPRTGPASSFNVVFTGFDRRHRSCDYGPDGCATRPCIRRRRPSWACTAIIDPRPNDAESDRRTGRGPVERDVLVAGNPLRRACTAPRLVAMG